VQVDMLAYNGIVHAMDGIILPNGGPPTQSSSTVPSPPSFSAEDPATAFPTAPTSNAQNASMEFVVVALFLMTGVVFLRS